MCGTDHVGFWIEVMDPGIVNGVVSWSDLAYLTSSGMTEGPVLSGTPAPTPTVTPEALPAISGESAIFLHLVLCLALILFTRQVFN